MSRPQPVKLGPFIGGMNNASDVSSISDKELVDCVNLELDLDGSLVCRPPIVETTNHSGTTTERLVVIGRATLAGVNYIIASNTNGTYAFNGTSWSTVQTGVVSRCAIQYQDLLFVVATPGSGVNGGFWNGSVWTSDANMPRGESAIFHKSRMFIVPGVSQTGAAAHQLRYSDPIPVAAPTPLVWPAANNVPVGQGDGQNLVDIQSHNDNLMLFKQDSTYVLAYDLLIQDAILRKISDNLGTSWRHCSATYENSIFIYHEGNIYKITNYQFEQVNLQCPFIVDTTVPASTTRAEEVFMSKLGTRLLIRYFNRVYSYNLRTGTWSRWSSLSPLLHNFGPLVEFPSSPIDDDANVYYAGSSITQHENMYKITDGIVTNVVESTLAPANFDIECIILTKNYDFDDAFHFKKLAWWGLDYVSSKAVEAIVTPVVLNFSITWDQLGAYTWDQLSAYTWDSPITAILFVETDITDSSSAGRKFAKFKQAMRFRQANFKIKLLSDGSPATGPARVFSLLAMVGQKETVVKKIS